MDDYLDGRTNVAAYSDLYSTVLMGVIGKVEYKHRVSTYGLGQEISTISDEALGLLIVENYIDRWVDMYKKSKGKIRILHGGEAMPKEWLSTVATKYTASASDGIRFRGLKAAADDTDDSYNRKWTADGIARFNELRLFVKQDRLDNPNFIVKWITDAKKTMKGRRRSDNAFEEADKVVEADNDLDSCDDHNEREGEPIVKPKNLLGLDDTSTENDDDNL